jgi:acyl carrier protein
MSGRRVIYVDGAAVARTVLAKLSGLEAGSLEPGMDLVADVGIDSPKAVELLVELEDALGVQISDEDASRMETVGDVLSYAASATR